MKLDALRMAPIVLALLSAAPLTACASATSTREPAAAAGALASPSYRPEYVVGGRVKGLEGVGLSLRGLHGEEIKIDDDGRFAFGTRLADGSSYNVTVGQEPISPVQSCVVERGAGRIVGKNAVEITVECTTARYEVPAPSPLPSAEPDDAPSGGTGDTKHASR